MLTAWEDWLAWAGSYTMLPYVEKYELADSGVVSWEKAWATAAPAAFVLESGKDGRYTFLGLAPFDTIAGKGESAVAQSSDGESERRFEGSPLDVLKRWMAPYRAPRAAGVPKFTGGCVGYLGYDVARSLERLPSLAADDLGIPDYAMALYDRVWAIDHAEGALYCAVHTPLLPLIGGLRGRADLDERPYPPREKTMPRHGGGSEEKARPAGHQVTSGEGGAADGQDVRHDAAGRDMRRDGAGPDASMQPNEQSARGEAAVGPLGPDELRQLYDAARETAAAMKRQWDAMTAFAADEPAVRRRRSFEADLSPDKLRVDIESIAGLRPAFDRAAFMRAVERIRAYIAAGDVFQVNLSVRQSRALSRPPALVYEWLRLLNPSPYMAYLRFPGVELVSGSPELLVQLEKGTVRTRPIAGTRPRGATDEEDERLAGELLANEKERAEHVMLVDLERNDLGKISRYGTIKVDDFMTIERYSHVMHIVSGVSGELVPGKDAFDVIAATFPGGTITGAPKVRTMEIIEELEPVRRGPYTGSIGWIDYGGDMELNIVIRTMVVACGISHVQAGAGIVIDSDPHREYAEALNKAKAMWKAIQYSELE